MEISNEKTYSNPDTHQESLIDYSFGGKLFSNVHYVESWNISIKRSFRPLNSTLWSGIQIKVSPTVKHLLSACVHTVKGSPPPLWIIEFHYWTATIVSNFTS